MSTDQTAKARKDAQIEVAICDLCFVSVPAEQAGTHSEWHRTKPTAAVASR